MANSDRRMGPGIGVIFGWSIWNESAENIVRLRFGPPPRMAFPGEFSRGGWSAEAESA